MHIQRKIVMIAKKKSAQVFSLEASLSLILQTQRMTLKLSALLARYFCIQKSFFENILVCLPKQNSWVWANQERTWMAKNEDWRGTSRNWSWNSKRRTRNYRQGWPPKSLLLQIWTESWATRNWTLSVTKWLWSLNLRFRQGWAGLRST